MESKDDLNPLQIPLILCEIFIKLKIQDQKNFRLVDKFWLDATLCKWRSSEAFIKICDTPEHPKRYEDTDLDEFLKLQKGGEFEAYRISEVPFRQFKINLRNYDFSKSNFGKEKDSDWIFWHEFGRTIEHLHLAKCIFRSAGSSLDPIQWVLNKCVNLKVLNLSFVNVIARNLVISSEDKQSSHEVSTTFKNLKSIRLDFFKFYKTEPQDQALEFRKVLDLAPNLKSVTLGFICDDAFLNAASLPGRGPDLECISFVDYLHLERGNSFKFFRNYVQRKKPFLRKVDIHQVQLDKQRIYPFHFYQSLSLCSVTLTDLSLSLNFRNVESNGNFWITDLTGIFFPNLTNLSLYVIEKEFRNRESLGVEGQFARFDFQALKGMPRIRKFTCTSSYFTYSEEDRMVAPGENLTEKDIFFQGDIPWNRNVVEQQDLMLIYLEEFHFQLWQGFAVESLKLLGEWMRNVEKIKLVSDLEASQVKEIFPTLKKLVLLDGSETPSEICF